MPSHHEIEKYLLDNFPLCPICKSDEGYIAFGSLIKTVACLKCGAKFQSRQFNNLKPLREMVLWEVPTNGQCAQLRRKKQSAEFWKNFKVEEYISKATDSVQALIGSSISWQKDETMVFGIEGCKEYIEDRTSKSGVRLGSKGHLIVTNHRILFAGKTGSSSKDYALSYGINLEDVMGVSHVKFGFNDKLVILEKNGHHRDFVKFQIQELIPTINEMMAKRINELKAHQKGKTIKR